MTYFNLPNTRAVWICVASFCLAVTLLVLTSVLTQYWIVLVTIPCMGYHLYNMRGSVEQKVSLYVWFLFVSIFLMFYTSLTSESDFVIFALCFWIPPVVSIISQHSAFLFSWAVAPAQKDLKDILHAHQKTTFQGTDVTVCIQAGTPKIYLITKTNDPEITRKMHAVSDTLNHYNAWRHWPKAWTNIESDTQEVLGQKYPFAEYMTGHFTSYDAINVSGHEILQAHKLLQKYSS